jgi:hypothetical protein
MKGEEELPGVEEVGCRWSVGFAGGAAVEAGGGVRTAAPSSGGGALFF